MWGWTPSLFCAFLSLLSFIFFCVNFVCRKIHKCTEMSLRHLRSDCSFPLLPGSPCFLHTEAVHKVSPGLWSSQSWAPKNLWLWGHTQPPQRGDGTCGARRKCHASNTSLEGMAFQEARVQSGCRPQHQPGCDSDCTPRDLSFVFCKVDMMMVPTLNGWHKA